VRRHRYETFQSILGGLISESVIRFSDSSSDTRDHQRIKALDEQKGQAHMCPTLSI